MIQVGRFAFVIGFRLGRRRRCRTVSRRIVVDQLFNCPENVTVAFLQSGFQNVAFDLREEAGQRVDRQTFGVALISGRFRLQIRKQSAVLVAGHGC